MNTVLDLKETLAGVPDDAWVLITLGRVVCPHDHNVLADSVRFTRLIESRNPDSGELVCQEAPCEKAEAESVYLTIESEG